MTVRLHLFRNKCLSFLLQTCSVMCFTDTPMSCASAFESEWRRISRAGTSLIQIETDEDSFVGIKSHSFLKPLYEMTTLPPSVTMKSYLCLETMGVRCEFGLLKMPFEARDLHMNGNSSVGVCEPSVRGCVCPKYLVNSLLAGVCEECIATRSSRSLNAPGTCKSPTFLKLKQTVHIFDLNWALRACRRVFPQQTHIDPSS